MFKKNIIISTTSQIEGREITKYFGLIHTSIVLGTDFVSDWIAGFTDFFGGRSSTYEQHLTQIYEEAMEQFTDKAIERGCNAVVGVKIDLEQLSGNNKAMFTVIVTGTGVLLNLLETDVPKIPDEHISATDLNMKINQIMLAKYSINVSSLNELDWTYLLTKYPKDFANTIIGKIGFLKSNDKGSCISKALLNQIAEYLYHVLDENVVKTIYDVYFSEIDIYAEETFQKVISMMNAIDYDHIEKHLMIDNFEENRKAIALLQFDKEYYNKQDLVLLKSIGSILENNFQPKWKEIAKSFKGVKRMAWVCKCGESHNDSILRCDMCSRNQYGFKPNQYSSHQALEEVTGRITALTEFYSVK